MRRTLSRFVAVSAIVLLGAGGCATDSSGSGTQPGDKPKVVTTFTVLADIARNVAGEHLEVESLTKVGAEIHGYEPTPGDIRRAAHADLIVDNGLNLEVWFQQFVADLDVPHVQATQGIEVMDITGDAYAGLPNPHAWMSPLNVKIYARNLADAFSELAPDHASEFQRNAAQYGKELDAVHQQLVDTVQGLPPAQRALVTCEGAFSYLARDAGMSEHYIWPVNAERQATPGQIKNVIEFVNANDVPAVFCESTVSNEPMQRVVEATNARFGGVLYVDSLSLPDGPVPTYLELITHDVTVITSALKGGSQ